MSGDYYATLKIQQGRLKAAMAKAGFLTQKALAVRAETSQSTVWALLNFKSSPRGPDGSWRPAVVRICAVLGCDCEQLFPDHLHHEIATNKISHYVERAQLAGVDQPLQLTPGEEVGRADAARMVKEVLAKHLSPVECSVLDGRFWRGEGLWECGKRIGLSCTRVQQIEEKALRKLRHPTRIGLLESAVPWETR